MAPLSFHVLVPDWGFGGIMAMTFETWQALLSVSPFSSEMGLMAAL